MPGLFFLISSSTKGETKKKGCRNEKQTVIFLLAAMLVIILGCNGLGIGGSGKIVREKRDAVGFTGIELMTIGKIIPTQGDADSVEVETDDNIPPLVETKVENGGLSIRSPSKEGIQPTNELLYYITVGDLENLCATGSGNALAEDFDVEDLTISITNAGRIDFGSITSQTLEVNLEGSGVFNAQNLITNTARITSAKIGDFTFGSIKAQNLDVIIENGNFSTEVLEADAVNPTINKPGPAT